jgi:cytidylate kinase
MIIAIDGPAGAGKSSIAKLLAARLGHQFLDTGAMYRSITLACLDASVDLANSDAKLEIAKQCELSQVGDVYFLNGVDVSQKIRDQRITKSVVHVANEPRIRDMLVEHQRSLAARHDLVTEGRDQATVAFPNAEYKIFLTASPQTRAIRRANELAQRGQQVDLEILLAEQNQRDDEDTNRPVGGLVRSDEAYYVSTDDLTIEQVVEKLVRLVQSEARLSDATNTFFLPDRGE